MKKAIKVLGFSLLVLILLVSCNFEEVDGAENESEEILIPKFINEIVQPKGSGIHVNQGEKSEVEITSMLLCPMVKNFMPGSGNSHGNNSEIAIVDMGGTEVHFTIQKEPGKAPKYIGVDYIDGKPNPVPDVYCEITLNKTNNKDKDMYHFDYLCVIVERDEMDVFVTKGKDLSINKDTGYYSGNLEGCQYGFWRTTLINGRTYGTVQHTATEWLSLSESILPKGQIGLESDTRKYKTGDGSTKWGDLPYSSEEGHLEFFKGTAHSSATEVVFNCAELWSGINTSVAMPDSINAQTEGLNYLNQINSNPTFAYSLKISFDGTSYYMTTEE